jgi:hypothetical protein
MVGHEQRRPLYPRTDIAWRAVLSEHGLPARRPRSRRGLAAGFVVGVGGFLRRRFDQSVHPRGQFLVGHLADRLRRAGDPDDGRHGSRA